MSRISRSCSTQWCGKWIFMVTVSTRQPRKSLMVSQLQSPLCIFLRDTGSRQDWESSAVKGRKTWSIAWSKVFRTRQVLGVFPSNTKLSTNIFTYSRGFPIVGSGWLQVMGDWTDIPGAGARYSLARFGNGTSAAIWSRRWLRGWYSGRLIHLLERSATVSVAVENTGGRFFHHMGNTRGKATIA